MRFRIHSPNIKFFSRGAMPTGLVIAMFATSILGLVFSFRVLQVSTTAKTAFAASPTGGGGPKPTSKPTAKPTSKPQPSGGGGPQPTSKPTDKPQPSGGGGPQPTSKPTDKPGGGGGPQPTDKPGGGGNNSGECLKDLVVDPQIVDRNGSFNCKFNYGTKLSGAHLSCAIVQNGLLVTGKNLYGNNIGCTYDATKSDHNADMVFFTCIAPDAAGTYEVQGFLDPVSKQSNPPIESIPSGCPVTPLTAGLCVGGSCNAAPPPTSAPTPTPPAACLQLFGKYN